MKEAVWSSRQRLELSFKWATTESLRAVLTLGVRVLHYSGHGHPRFLSFEDGSGGAHLFSVDSLKELIRAGHGSSSLRLVFVAACSSRAAGDAFVKAGIAHVVCVQIDAEVSDDAARVFTKAFYLSLFVGKTVAESFDIAQKSVEAAPNVVTPAREAAKFVLLPADSDHEEALFSGSMAGGNSSMPSLMGDGRHEDGAWQSSDSSSSENGADSSNELMVEARVRRYDSSLPNLPDLFIGRNVPVYLAVNALLKTRLISICGKVGIGKSTVGLGAAHYLMRRGHIRRGAVFLRATHLRTTAALIEAAEAIIHDRNRRRSAGRLNQSQVQMQQQQPLTSDVSSSLSSLALAARPSDDPTLRARNSSSFLLFLDGVDAVITKDAVSFAAWLSEMLSRHKHWRILLTTSVPLVEVVHGVGQKVVHLGPLDGEDTARLLFKCAPRALTYKEVGIADAGSSVLAALCSHRLLPLLEGNPSAINRAAVMLSNQSLDGVAEQWLREKEREQREREREKEEKEAAELKFPLREAGSRSDFGRYKTRSQ